jgi:hypothetical protein
MVERLKISDNLIGSSLAFAAKASNNAGFLIAAAGKIKYYLPCPNELGRPRREN